MKAQFHVVEYMLTSKAGLSRRDIRGDERSGYHRTPRYDVTASIRRVLSRAGRLRACAGVGAAFSFVGIATALAGLESTASFVAIVGGFVSGLCYYRLPDAVFESPPDVVTETKSTTPGMTEQEVYRTLAIHAERQDLKEEKIEREQKRRERRSKHGGPRR